MHLLKIVSMNLNDKHYFILNYFPMYLFFVLCNLKPKLKLDSFGQ